MNARALPLAALLAMALPAPARAAELSPLGRWRTIDDATGLPKSIVLIYEEAGKLIGRIESLIVQPGEDPAPKCDKCDGERKDQPVIGMVILWDLARGEDGDEWSGGRILDPKNGKTYRCYLKPIDEGNRLKVRGFLGIALFGRTQVWQRVE